MLTTGGVGKTASSVCMGLGGGGRRELVQEGVGGGGGSRAS